LGVWNIKVTEEELNIFVACIKGRKMWFKFIKLYGKEVMEKAIIIQDRINNEL
jgi:hypothetical protein